MDDTLRETLRRRLVRALDAIDSARPAAVGWTLPHVPVLARDPRLPARRPPVRPVRSWARLTRI